MGSDFSCLGNRLGHDLFARSGKQDRNGWYERCRTYVETRRVQDTAGRSSATERFYLDDCLKRLGQDGRTAERWGGGDNFIERTYRVAGALDLAFLIAPPFGLLLLGTLLAWVVGGFTKTKAR